MADKKELLGVIMEKIESLGYECVALDLKDARAGVVLRIYIDTPEGVKHEDCERVSRAVAEYMDEREEAGTPWFDGKYFVEVSSPGLERPLFTLEHYRRFIGKSAKFLLRSGRKFTGVIESLDEKNNVTVAADGDGARIVVPFEDIKRANLVFVVEKGEKKNASKQAKKNNNSK